MSYIKGKRVALSEKPTEESIAFAEYCKDLFEYREDGSLVRKKTTNHNAQAGSIVGSLTNNRYVQVKVDSVIYQLHQIVFLLHYNYIPKTIDHIDRDKANNSIENLRSVSTRANNLNRSDNSETSNIYKNGKGFQVCFYFEGKRETFGTFNTLEEAESIRDRITNDLTNWRNYLPIKTKDKPNRYIYKNDNGFKIQKTIKGVTKYFGTYKTLEEAITARSELESNDWTQK